MRTLRLKEWTPESFELTTTEITRLLSVPDVLAVRVKDPRSGVYEVRPNSVVGTLVWPELQVLIKPKIALDNLFFLLGYRGGLARWSANEFPYEVRWDLMRSIAWAFRAEVEWALRHGLTRSYEERVERLPALRGRLDVGRQLAARRGLPYPVECRFSEYAENYLLNRLLKAATVRLLRLGGLDLSVVRSLQLFARELATVDGIDVPPWRVPDVHFTRLNAHWESAFRLARLILRGQTLRDEVGTTAGIAFTVNMDALFEKFVEEIVAEEVWRAGLEFNPQLDVHLTQRVRMRPDLVLLEGNRPVAVGDAKYIDEKDGWPNSNMYQLLAYCVALGLRRGLLIYAAPRELEHQRVRRAGIELEIIGIDMSKPADGLIEEARAAARRLISHAREERSASVG